MKSKTKPIAERIAEAYRVGCDYFDLERAVFPAEDYPRAWNYKAEGGPPGCRMALMAALRRHGYTVVHNDMLGGSRQVYRKGRG